MERVCILTKTIMAEAELQNKLQVLGYEVFVSSQLLELFLDDIGIESLKIFKTIIFSETVCDQEVQKIFQTISRYRIRVFRMDGNEAEYLDTTIIENEMPVRLPAKISLNALREELSRPQIRETMPDVIEDSEKSHDFSYQDYRFMGFINSLSHNEKKLFDILLEANGNYVQRKDLSEQVWGKGVSNSTLTQLSQLIYRIRKKMLKVGLEGNSLQTNWREGYALSKDFFKEDIAM
ncbi:winged helix-turn-helix domain-containing protein [Enterococcus sp. LJL90]